MRILSIETSCDETAIALLEINGEVKNPNIKIVANNLLSQIDLHKEYGGVYPNLAKREHQKNLPILLKKTLEEALENEELPDIDYIAVTKGPGLEPALWTGIKLAEELSKKWGKPIVDVNHMAGHIWSVLYNQVTPIKLPAIALLVSGGHTELVKVSGPEEYKILGKTLDDAVGEAFDKVARMLDLPYPGGPKISALADEARTERIKPSFSLPRPMLHSKNLDFSFSGLKTSVLYKTKENKITEDYKKEMALEFENACIDVLLRKTEEALDLHTDVESLIVSGGVSANKELRKRALELSENRGITLLLPEKNLSTDNAVMIGIAGYIRTQSPTFSGGALLPIKAVGNLKLD